MSKPVLTEFFVEASDALVKMSDESVRLAQCFRGSALQDAHDGLDAFMTELRQFPVLVGELTGSLEIDPRRLRINDVPVEEQLVQLGATIESLIAAHQHSDWLTVADVLERELEPMLRSWAHKVLECLAPYPAAQPA